MLYALYRIGMFLDSVLPKCIFYPLVSAGAMFHYRRSDKDRGTVRDNLSEALGMKGEELDRCSKRIFVNFARYLADFFDPRMPRRFAVDRNVKVEGIEFVEEALKHGKGCIFLTGHYGNWEIGGCVLSRYGYRLHVIAMSHKDPRINKLFTDLRQASGEEVIELGEAGRLCPGIFARNEIVAILGDRTFGAKGVYVDFFGKRALMPRGAALFSVRYGVPLLPTFISHAGTGKYTVRFYEPIFPERDIPAKDNIQGLTQKFIKVFERQIKEDPTQWYMFRRLWE